MSRASRAAPASIERITEKNVGLLSDIAPDVFDGPIDPTHLANYLSAPGHALFVAEEGGLIVGQVRGVVLHQPDTSPILYIDNLGVAPTHQRRGIATRLFHAVCAWGDTSGAGAMWVSADADNDEATAFYTALGLKGITMVYYERYKSRP
ncbi:MAG: GNAT family N-acetyltransferase [Proteobacteria bacterium]|nr:GNAT family N-acetyltransferase [Pseudomonadota bacterium]